MKRSASPILGPSRWPPDLPCSSSATLCVPAHESLDVIRGQLVALAAVDYPHDSWVPDEGNDDAVRPQRPSRPREGRRSPAHQEQRTRSFGLLELVRWNA